MDVVFLDGAVLLADPDHERETERRRSEPKAEVQRELEGAHREPAEPPKLDRLNAEA